MEVYNSENFALHDADNYYERNKDQIYPNYETKKMFNISEFDEIEKDKLTILEIGVGNGTNLKFLRPIVDRVCGLDICRKSIENLNSIGIPGYTHNICKPIKINEKFDIVIGGFFAYLCSEKEMHVVKQNIDELTHDYFYVYDFLSSDYIITKKDKRNPEINIYKRPLKWWNELFSNYVLVNFELTPEDINNEDTWYFNALYKRIK